MAFTIEVIENEDATGFKLYDLTNYSGGFVWSDVTLVTLTVIYNSITYTHILYDTGITPVNHLGMDGTFINLCGSALNSYYEVSPADLLYSGTPLDTVHFPDGYYEISLTVVDTVLGTETDDSNQGFLANNYMLASKLPLLINLDDFNYEENRLQFLCIALLNSATWAAELGKRTEFETIVTKANAFLDARSINETL